MNAGQRSARRVANGVLSRDNVCTSCLTRLSHQANTRRHAATAAAAAAAAPSSSSTTPDAVHPVTASGPEKAYALFASPLISRPPILTRELTSFEKAYYLYQKRLNERTALPFSRYFYYRQGTVEDKEWKRKMRGRKSAARDIGQYTGYGPEAWNDEVLVGDTLGEWQSQAQALLHDAEGKTITGAALVSEEEKAEALAAGKKGGGAAQPGSLKDAEIPKPFPRLSQADHEKDVRSLSRKMDRVLYLIVQNKDGRWRFPEDRVHGRESLEQASERILVQSCGINMNTWMVGNHPVGHHNFSWPTKGQGRLVKTAANPLVPTSTEVERLEFGEKVFFMKGRIMAGQADLSKNAFGDRDFRWLTKEEISSLVTQAYWSSIRNMLTER